MPSIPLGSLHIGHYPAPLVASALLAVLSRSASAAPCPYAALTLACHALADVFSSPATPSSGPPPASAPADTPSLASPDSDTSRADAAIPLVGLLSALLAGPLRLERPAPEVLRLADEICRALAAATSVPHGCRPLAASVPDGAVATAAAITHAVAAAVRAAIAARAPACLTALLQVPALLAGPAPPPSPRTLSSSQPTAPLPAAGAVALLESLRVLCNLVQPRESAFSVAADVPLPVVVTVVRSPAARGAADVAAAVGRLVGRLVPAVGSAGQPEGVLVELTEALVGTEAMTGGRGGEGCVEVVLSEGDRKCYKGPSCHRRGQQKGRGHAKKSSEEGGQSASGHAVPLWDVFLDHWQLPQAAGEVQGYMACQSPPRCTKLTRLPLLPRFPPTPRSPRWTCSRSTLPHLPWRRER